MRPREHGASNLDSVVRKGSVDVAEQLFIGLMSGTSRDGLDAVLVGLDDQQFRLICARMTPYPDSIGVPLWKLVESAHCRLDELGRLHTQFGEFAAACIDNLLREAQIPANRVVAVGFSGHTIFHQPEPPNAFSLQLGNPNIVAARTGIDTVADLRGMDVAVGGQGAPLLPAFHAWQFASAEESRIVVNVGGIANLTRLAPGKPIVGFDSGPANTLMDAWARRHSIGDYDDGGRWATSGRVNADLLRLLQDDEYFARQPPKSTGLEHFNLDWLDRRLTVLGDLPSEDVQATLLELTAISITESAKAVCPELSRLIVCGGGCYNTALMNRLRALLPQVTIETSDAHGIAPEWVEAAGFAWFARSRLEGRPANVPSVTGARRHVDLGGVYSGRKYDD